MRFEETQYFRQWWLWLIIIGSAASPFITTLWAGHSIHTSLLFTLITPVLLIVLFRILRLDTIVDSTGIHYRFFPFHTKMQDVLWEDLTAAYIRQYKPIAEYGGWGIRYGFKSKKAFNVAGNMGLQLEFKNGKSLLIGTQKPDELQNLLTYLNIQGKR